MTNIWSTRPSFVDTLPNLAQMAKMWPILSAFSPLLSSGATFGEHLDLGDFWATLDLAGIAADDFPGLVSDRTPTSASSGTPSSQVALCVKAWGPSVGQFVGQKAAGGGERARRLSGQPPKDRRQVSRHGSDGDIGNGRAGIRVMVAASLERPGLAEPESSESSTTALRSVARALDASGPTGNSRPRCRRWRSMRAKSSSASRGTPRGIFGTTGCSWSAALRVARPSPRQTQGLRRRRVHFRRRGASRDGGPPPSGGAG